MASKSGAELAAQLRAVINDDHVLAAIAAVPRDLFVPPELRADAFANAPQPIGCGQTISQPLVVARMCELLELSRQDRVLDVGTGSGYHAAVLARLCAHVYSIERHERLSEQAARNLESAGTANVSLFVGDGSRGLPEHAPFEAINVGAAAWRSVPPALEQQLAEGGRLVAPIARVGQRLVLVRRTERGFERQLLEPVRFVPLVQ
jgi:protein-L-isoaspartate(D-aspartate) O-methyltransferase